MQLFLFPVPPYVGLHYPELCCLANQGIHTLSRRRDISWIRVDFLLLTNHPPLSVPLSGRRFICLLQRPPGRVHDVSVGARELTLNESLADRYCPGQACGRQHLVSSKSFGGSALILLGSGIAAKHFFDELRLASKLMVFCEGPAGFGTTNSTFLEQRQTPEL